MPTLPYHNSPSALSCAGHKQTAQVEQPVDEKLTDEASHHTHAQFSRIVEWAMDAIITVDEDGRVLLFNRAAEKMFLCSAEEVMGQSIDRFIPERARMAHKGRIKNFCCAEANGRPMASVSSTFGLRSNGEEFPVEASISQIESDGRKLFTVILRDITEHKSLEEQLQQAQRMEAIGRLAGGVAHDFNNLLTAITGYSDLTLRKLNERDPLRANIEEVGKAAQRAASLTRQLLAFSRKQIMQPKVLDLNAIIREMNKMLPRLVREDIKIEMKLAGDLGRIKADPGQLEQVIVNLVVNARDAMPQGGVITIETSNVNMDEELVKKYRSIQPGPHILLKLSDTGCGMDAETQAHIFEPFFTTKEVGKGTGLGLSAVFGIVKQSGGSVWVNSEVGRGSSFSIYLPRVDAQVDVQEIAAGPKKLAQGTETVLLVEDDELVRRVARTTLELCGYKVLEAANGGEALLISRELKGNIDLMLTDVVMPRMNGRRLGKELARLRPRMKVLYMSGHTYDETASHGVFTDRLAFIHKPFTPEDLSVKIREVLDSD